MSTIVSTSTPTLYQPHHYPNIKNSHHTEHLDSIDELTRTSTIQTHNSISSDIYLDPDHDYKIVLNFSEQEIKLVRTTWKEMVNDDLTANEKTAHTSIASSLFCIQFYSNLLAMDNNLEKMFPSIKHQAISFAGVLSTAIINLENLQVLDDYLLNLGKRHARILGIDPPHFELMGVALLKTFQDRFGLKFTLELERSWARLYTYLANSILQFGIDPVLKNQKINNDLNLSILSKTQTNQTMVNSIYDQKNSSYTTIPSSRTGSVSSTGSGSTIAAPRSFSVSSNSGLPIPPVNLKQAGNFVQNNRTTKRNSSQVKAGINLTAGEKAGGFEQDEKCVIM